MLLRTSSIVLVLFSAVVAYSSESGAIEPNPNQLVSDARKYLIDSQFERESKTESVSKAEIEGGQTIPLPETDETSITRYARSAGEGAVWSKRSGKGRGDELVLRRNTRMVRQIKGSQWKLATHDEFHGLERVTDLGNNPFLLPVIDVKSAEHWEFSGNETLGGIDAVVLVFNDEQLLSLAKEYQTQVFGAMFKGKQDAPVRVKLESASVRLWLARKDSRPLKVVITQSMRITPPGSPDTGGVNILGTNTTTVVFRYDVKELIIPPEAITLISEQSEK